MIGLITRSAVLLITLGAVQICQADVLTFDDSDEFDAYIGSFNSELQQEGFNFSIGFAGFQGPIVTPSLTVTCEECGLGLETQRNGILEGSHILRTHANVTQFDFGREVNVLSFFILDFGDQLGDFDEFLDLSTSAGEQFRLGFRAAGSANPQNTLIFFGLISDRPFSSFQLLTNQPRDGINIDPIRFGEIRFPVPEPGTLALLGLGLIGMAARRTRRSA